MNEAIRFGSALVGPVNGTNDQEKAVVLLAALRAAKERTFEAENERGVVAFLTNTFSFINVIWFGSTIGIAITIGPVILIVLSPLIKMFSRLTDSALWACRKVRVLLFRAVRAARAFLSKLAHELGADLWRPLFYITAAGTFAHATDTDMSSDTRIFCCLLMALLSHAVFAHTLIAMVPEDGNGHIIGGAELLYLCGIFLYGVLAHLTTSSLIGFLAVVCVFSMLGFGMAATPFGFVIGFGREDRLWRCVGAALVLLLVSISARLSGKAWLLALLAPFAGGIQTFGSTAFYLGLFIKAELFWSPNDRWHHAAFLAAVLFGAAAGNLVPMRGLCNTAYVFAYLFSLDALAFWSNKLGRLWCVFFTSVFSFYGANWLHAHPELLIAIYTFA